MTCSRLGAYASRPGHHAVNMLTEERAAPLQATSWRTAPMQLHGCARHCRVACSNKPPELSNLAYRLRRASRTVPG